MVDYDFYANDFLGSAIPEKDFPGMAAQAQAVLNRFRRVYRVESTGPEAENMAICAMAEALHAAKCSRGGISSAAVGSMSVHYEGSEKVRKALMAELYEQASVYLDIYRGVGA